MIVNTVTIRWVLFLVLGTGLGRAAVPDGAVSTNVPPAWVKPWDWVKPEATGQADDTEGVRLLLVEQQDNPILHESHFRSVRLLENDSGVQDSGRVTFSFDPAFQTLILHYILVHRGEVTFDRLDLSELKIIQPEPGLSGNILTGRHSVILFVSDLRVGDVLEYAYTVRGSNPILDGHFSSVYLTKRYREMDRLRIRVAWPSSRPLYLRRHLVTEEPRVASLGEGKEYLWDLEEVPSIEYEDYQPAGNEPFPYVEFSDFDSWGRVLDWAVPLYEGAGSDLPAEAKELISGWRSEAASDEEAAALALSFVQDELRYTGLELGPDSYRPATPAQTLAKRYGDCKAKSLIYCQMVNALGIEAWPALVNSSSYEAVGRRLPSPFAFNHVIVKLLLDGQSIWLDPTISSQGGTLSKRYTPPYGKALVINKGVTELEEIPGPDSTQGLQSVSSSFKIKHYDAPATYTIQTVSSGREADEMRRFLAESTLKDIGEDYLNYNARYYPGITNARPLKVIDDREGNQVTVIEVYDIVDLWQTNETGGALEAEFYPESLYGMLSDPDSRLRKTPLRIGYPLRREQTISVLLPDNDWSIPTDSGSVEHAAFRFNYRRTGTSSSVIFYYECETLVPEVAPGEVASYLVKRGEMEGLLGDTLFRPDPDTPINLARINWLMVVVAGFTFFCASVGAIWVWFKTRVVASSVDDEIPLMLGDQNLRGLGGWLVLLGFGVVVGPFLMLGQIGIDWESYFSQPVWQEMTVPEGSQYHPLWGPVLIIQLMGNILLVVGNFLLICFFFAKRKAFRVSYIVFHAYNICLLFLSILMAQSITDVTDEYHMEAVGDLTKALFSAAIWVSYVLKSRRVKLTFVK